jgi:hypothetical protein
MFTISHLVKLCEFFELVGYYSTLNNTLDIFIISRTFFVRGQAIMRDEEQRGECQHYKSLAIRVIITSVLSVMHSSRTEKYVKDSRR